MLKQFESLMKFLVKLLSAFSAVFSGGAPPEFGGSEKGRSLISAYRSLAITTNTPGFKKLYTALHQNKCIDTLDILPSHYEVQACQNFVDYYRIYKNVVQILHEGAYLDLILDGAGGKVHSTGSKKKSVESRQEILKWIVLRSQWFQIDSEGVVFLFFHAQHICLFVRLY